MVLIFKKLSLLVCENRLSIFPSGIIKSEWGGCFSALIFSDANFQSNLRFIVGR